MAMVAATCTQCGGNIEVDDTKDAGICQFCGLAFVTEKVINNFSTFVTNNFDGANVTVVGKDMDNLLKLAKKSIEMENGEEALKHVNRILEVKVDSSEAWLVRMRAMRWVADVDDPKLKETSMSGHNAIKYASDEEKEHIELEVYNHFLDMSIFVMELAVNWMKDTSDVQSTLNNDIPSGLHVRQEKEALMVQANLEGGSIDLKGAIPEQFIVNLSEVQEKIRRLVRNCTELHKAMAMRARIHKRWEANQEKVEKSQSYEESFEKIIKGLPDEICARIREEEFVKIDISTGCYIATSVYGSYHSPQVMILRRFRDMKLKKTWYGRIFIKMYYSVSPTFVVFFGKTKWFQRFWRSCLDKKVMRLKERGYGE